MLPTDLIKTNSEGEHQKAFFAWINKAHRYGVTVASYEEAYYTHERALAFQKVVDDVSMLDFDLIHAIPNGGDRSARQGSSLKVQGVKPGIPDIFVPIPMVHRSNNSYITKSGLYIEMKKPELMRKVSFNDLQSILSVASSDQQDKITRLSKLGYVSVICFTWQQAVYELCHYMQHMPENYRFGDEGFLLGGKIYE